MPESMKIWRIWTDRKLLLQAVLFDTGAYMLSVALLTLFGYVFSLGVIHPPFAHASTGTMQFSCGATAEDTFVNGSFKTFETPNCGTYWIGHNLWHDGFSKYAEIWWKNGTSTIYQKIYGGNSLGDSFGEPVGTSTQVSAQFNAYGTPHQGDPYKAVIFSGGSGNSTVTDFENFFGGIGEAPNENWTEIDFFWGEATSTHTLQITKPQNGAFISDGIVNMCFFTHTSSSYTLTLHFVPLISTSTTPNDYPIPVSFAPTPATGRTYCQDNIVFLETGFWEIQAKMKNSIGATLARSAVDIQTGNFSDATSFIGKNNEQYQFTFNYASSVPDFLRELASTSNVDLSPTVIFQGGKSMIDAIFIPLAQYTSFLTNNFTEGDALSVGQDLASTTDAVIGYVRGLSDILGGGIIGSFVSICIVFFITLFLFLVIYKIIRVLLLR